MPDNVIAALQRLKYELAAENVVRALARLADACKANFNPNQPRVPPGNPDGGQWTYVSGWARGRNDPRVLSDAMPDNAWKPLRVAQGPRRPSVLRPIRIGSRWFQPTPAEAIRLEAAERDMQAAIARVRTLDPEWRPQPSAYATVEGLIRSTEAAAREARARYDELRRGIGGNFGPPLTPSAAPTPRRLDGPAWIELYRAVPVRRDMFGNEVRLTRADTVAVAEIDGRPVFGINSKAPTYTAVDRVAARRAVDTLVRKYPDVMSTDNLGQMPNESLFHAESTILLRAAREHGGTLAGRTIIVHVDREMCDSCIDVLPKLGLELGNPNVTYIDHSGAVLTMQNGFWID